MDVITETELLERINAFRARHHDMAPTTFGRRATGNANLIKELEDGKSPSLRTVQRVAAFMRDADEEAATHAKLTAPIAPNSPGDEEEIPLPFSQAPVNPTAASSPTSSPTTERPRTPAANGSCPDCSKAADAAAAQPSHSCSAEDAFVRDPSKPTEVAR